MSERLCRSGEGVTMIEVSATDAHDTGSNVGATSAGGRNGRVERPGV